MVRLMVTWKLMERIWKLSDVSELVHLVSVPMNSYKSYKRMFFASLSRCCFVRTVHTYYRLWTQKSFNILTILLPIGFCSVSPKKAVFKLRPSYFVGFYQFYFQPRLAGRGRCRVTFSKGIKISFARKKVKK